MRTYLKNNLPKFSLILIIIFFVTNLLTLLFPRLSSIFLLYTSNLSEPLNWYRFFTYPLYVGGMINWIHNSLVIFLTGFIIENKLKRKGLIILILLSSFIGGFSFIILNQNDNLSMATPTMISWGYWSATIVLGFKFWKAFNLFEKVIVVLCLMSIFSIWNDNLGFLIGQILVIIIVAISTVIKIKKE